MRFKVVEQWIKKQTKVHSRLKRQSRLLESNRQSRIKPRKRAQMIGKRIKLTVCQLLSNQLKSKDKTDNLNKDFRTELKEA